MKKIILIAAAMLLTASAYCQVPTYGNNTLYGGAGSTSNVLAASTNTVNSVMYVGKQAKVGVQLSWSCDAATTGVCTYTFLKSIDGINYENQTANIVTVAPTNNGTNIIVVVTNLDTAGCAYMKLTTVANTNATANMTNFNCQYASKISAP